MTISTGSKILYTDYNTIQTAVSNILGTGTGQLGYGQTPLSSQVPVTKITATHWANLKADILVIAAHQGVSSNAAIISLIGASFTGTIVGTTLTVSSVVGTISIGDAVIGTSVSNGTYITAGSGTTWTLNNSKNVSTTTMRSGGKFLSGDKITAGTITAFTNAIPAITSNTFAIVEYSDESFSPTITSNRTTAWGSAAFPSITHSFVIDFGSSDAARAFFNSGSSLRFASARSGGTSSIHNTNWTTLLSSIGTVIFNYNSTVASTPGTSIGFYNLTSTDRLIFSASGNSTYSSNNYSIYIKSDVSDNSNGGARYLNVRVVFTDTYVRPDYPETDFVDGTIISSIAIRRSSAVLAGGVTVPAPTAINLNLLSYGDNSGIAATVTPTTSSINEGGSAIFTVATTGLANGTLYWTNSGTTVGSDFNDSANSGSVTITNSSGTITRTLLSDLTTEGNETIIIQLRIGSVSGAMLATSSLVSVNDTSTAPIITYSIVPSTTSINEGSTVTYTVTTTNFGSGTLYWTNSGTTVGADFSGGLNSGSVIITSNSGTITRTLTSDTTTEGSETVIIQLRTVSTSGTVVATASTVYVSDTSTAPVTYSLTINPKPIAYVLMIGQSNIGAYGDHIDTYTPSGSVQRLTINGTWENAVSPAGALRLATGYNWSSGSVSATTGGVSGGNMDGRIGDALINSNIYSAVKIINVSVGGTNLAWWLSTSSNTAYTKRGEDSFNYSNNKLYERTQFAVNAANSAGFSFTHVLLGIGENDGLSNTSSTDYQNYFVQFKNDLRNLGVSAPIYISQTSYVSPSTNSNVTTAQLNIVAAYSDVYAGPNTDVYGSGFRWDGLHFNTSGLTALASEWAYSLINPSDTFLTTTTTYTFTSVANSITEGATITYTVTTTNFGNGTLYWTNSGTTVGADFDDGLNSGSVTITSDSGTITRIVSNDLTTEGSQTIIMELRTGSISGTIVATATTTNVIDTSTTPVITYNISSSVASVSEGGSVTFTVTTVNFGSGTLWWGNTGSSTGPDFSDGLNVGTVTITSNSGSFIKTLATDLTVETETIIMQLYKDSGRTLTAGSPVTVTIVDTSPTYQFSSIPSSINEGSAGTFNVTTANVTNGSTIYWYINNTTTANADFSAIAGSFQVSGNSGSFAITPLADALTEGSESFTVSLSLTNGGSALVTSSPVTTVNDTSRAPTDPTYQFTSVPTSINEGNSGTFVVTTTNVSNGTTLYWYVNNGTTSNGDFTTIASSFTITSNSGTFSVPIASDLVSDSAETFTVSISLTNGGAALITSSSITINDTTPTYTFSSIPSSINEGNSGTFNVTTTNVASGTTLYWTIETNAGQFGAANGSFTITGTLSSGTGSFTVTPSADLTTEGSMSFTVAIRTISTLGTIQVTSNPVSINDTSQTPVPTYSIALTSSNSVNEGGTVSYTVTTTNFPNGILYWSNLGTTIGADFTDGLNQNIVTITSNSGTITRTLSNDFLTEGSETIIIQLYTNSNRTISAGSAAETVTVNDTSLTVSYSVSPNTSLINEGQSVTYTVTATNFGSGTLYWTNSGTTSAADFSDAANSGPITITSDSGSFTKTLSNDITTEGNETIIIQLRTGSTSGTIVATSPTVVTVSDTSISPQTYSIVPNSTSINEGSSVTYTVTTTNFGNGTLYWTNGGTTVGADFDDGINQDSVTITNDSGTIVKALANDLTTEGSQTIIMQLRTGSTSGTIVAIASTVNVSDTSTTPVPTINSVTGASANEGASVSFSVSTSNITNGTSMSWVINHNTTSSSDFTASSGTFFITSNFGSFSIGINADSSTEGTENYTVTVSGASATPVTSPSYNINDTSLTPTISGYWSPSSLSFPSTLSSTFYWTVTNYTSNAGSYITVNDGGNTPTLLTTSTVYASSGNTGSVTFNNTGTGYAYGFIPNYFQSCTVPITVSPPAGISINNYPTATVYGTAFSYTITGGYPNETWSASWTGAFSGSASGNLASNGTASYSNGSFGANYGAITVSWTFSRSSQTPTRSVTNYAPPPSINYPSSVAGHGDPAVVGNAGVFSWSVSGLPNESFTVSFRGANTGGPYSLSLDSSGNFSNSGSWFANAGTTYLDWSFSSTSRQNAPYTTTTTTTVA